MKCRKMIEHRIEGYIEDRQCSRNAGYGPGGRYCKQHAEIQNEKDRKKHGDEWLNAMVKENKKG